MKISARSCSLSGTALVLKSSMRHKSDSLMILFQETGIALCKLTPSYLDGPGAFNLRYQMKIDIRDCAVFRN